VKYHIDAAVHGSPKLLAVKQVAGNEAKAGILSRRGQEFRSPGGEIIEAYDLMAVAEEAVDEIAADEAGAAGDEVTGHLRRRSLAGMMSKNEASAREPRLRVDREIEGRRGGHHAITLYNVYVKNPNYFPVIKGADVIARIRAARGVRA
jgi:hypothetical protein